MSGDDGGVATMNDPLEEVFAYLGRCRHLPSYQLERRFDVFLTPYLRDVLVTELPLPHPLHKICVPEMPLLKKYVSQPTGGKERKLSNKVDYVFFADGAPDVYFVELKTDLGSTREKQIEYLKAAQQAGFAGVLDELRGILRQTKAQRKYFHLLHLLASVGRIAITGCDTCDLCPKPRRGFRFANSFRSLHAHQPIHVVVIVPDKSKANRVDGWHYLDFGDLQRHIALRSDPLSRLLATKLVQWREPAASQPPGV